MHVIVLLFFINNTRVLIISKLGWALQHNDQDGDDPEERMSIALHDHDVRGSRAQSTRSDTDSIESSITDSHIQQMVCVISTENQMI